MWFLIPKILKHKSIQIQNPTYVFLDTPDLIKLLARLLPTSKKPTPTAPTPAAAPRARRRRRACACRRYGL